MLHTESFLKYQFSETSLFHRFPNTALAFSCQVDKFKANSRKARLSDQRQAATAPFHPL